MTIETSMESSQTSAWRLVPVEPTSEMISAAANTPGIKAIDNSSAIMQLRGYPLDKAHFAEGSPLLQAYRAMLGAAPVAVPAEARTMIDWLALEDYAPDALFVRVSVGRAAMDDLSKLRAEVVAMPRYGHIEGGQTVFVSHILALIDAAIKARP